MRVRAAVEGLQVAQPVEGRDGLRVAAQRGHALPHVGGELLLAGPALVLGDEGGDRLLLLVLGVGGGAAVGVAAQVVHPLGQLGGEEGAERDALGLVVLADGLEHPLVDLLAEVVGVGQVQPDRAHVALQALEADRAVVPAQVGRGSPAGRSRGARRRTSVSARRPTVVQPCRRTRRAPSRRAPRAEPQGAVDAVEAVALVVGDGDAVGQLGAELVERQLAVGAEVHPVAGGDGRERPALGLGDAAEDERLADAVRGRRSSGGRWRDAGDIGHRDSWDCGEGRASGKEARKQLGGAVRPGCAPRARRCAGSGRASRWSDRGSAVEDVGGGDAGPRRSISTAAAARSAPLGSAV